MEWNFISQYFQFESDHTQAPNIYWDMGINIWKIIAYLNFFCGFLNFSPNREIKIPKITIKWVNLAFWVANFKVIINRKNEPNQLKKNDVKKWRYQFNRIPKWTPWQIQEQNLITTNVGIFQSSITLINMQKIVICYWWYILLEHIHELKNVIWDFDAVFSCMEN